MPELYIITGSNGAGKSSVGPEYLPDYIVQQGPVFDSDKLLMQKKAELWQQGIRSKNTYRELANEWVDNLFNSLVDDAIKDLRSFAYEGHFSHESSWDTARRFKKAGYTIHLIFFGLNDTNISELRVKIRTQEGGHDVDPLMITANFYGNLIKLNEHFNWFDSVKIVDTSGTDHIELCLLESGFVVATVESAALPVWFRAHLPTIAALIP